jgi:hypothetical protein
MPGRFLYWSRPGIRGLRGGRIYIIDMAVSEVLFLSLALWYQSVITDEAQIRRFLRLAGDETRPARDRRDSLMDALQLLDKKMPVRASELPPELLPWLKQENLVDMKRAQLLPFAVGAEQSCFLLAPRTPAASGGRSAYFLLDRRMSVGEFERVLRSPPAGRSVRVLRIAVVEP